MSWRVCSLRRDKRKCKEGMSTMRVSLTIKWRYWESTTQEKERGRKKMRREEERMRRGEKKIRKKRKKMRVSLTIKWRYWERQKEM